MAQKRLQKEFMELAKCKNEHYFAAPDDETNVFNWSATVNGPVILPSDCVVG